MRLLASRHTRGVSRARCGAHGESQLTAVVESERSEVRSLARTWMARDAPLQVERQLRSRDDRAIGQHTAGQRFEQAAGEQRVSGERAIVASHLVGECRGDDAPAATRDERGKSVRRQLG